MTQNAPTRKFWSDAQAILPPQARYAGSYAGKRVFDVVFALMALLLTSPFLLLLALLVSMDGHSPLYSQPRLGRDGKVFRFLKFRTMVPDADKRLMHYLKTDNAALVEWETFQKLDHDPRITRFGRLLRKTSLDELPQFWNVLLGHMSVVGPRPMMPLQRNLYPGQDYFRMRPGITGPWQVSERNQARFADRARFDAWYFRNQSFARDMEFVFATLRTVVRMSGR